jgi:hypothetical protein
MEMKRNEEDTHCEITHCEFTDARLLWVGLVAHSPAAVDESQLGQA